MSRREEIVALSVFPNASHSILLNRLELLDVPKEDSLASRAAKGLKATRDRVLSGSSQLGEAVARGLSGMFGGTARRDRTSSGNVDYSSLNQDDSEHSGSEESVFGVSKDDKDDKETPEIIDCSNYPVEQFIIPNSEEKDFYELNKEYELKIVEGMFGTPKPERKAPQESLVTYDGPIDTLSSTGTSSSYSKNADSESIADQSETSNLMDETEHVKVTSRCLSGDRTQDETSGSISVVLCETYLYVLGVIRNGESTKLVVRKKVEKEVEGRTLWQRWEDLPCPCPFHAVASTSGALLICGGRSTISVPNEKLDIFYLFWPGFSKKWEMAGEKLVHCREKHRLIYYDHFLYAVGGKDENGYSMTSVEFTPMMQESPIPWDSGPSMIKARHSFACAVHKGFLYVVGGVSGNNYSSEALAEVERLRLKRNSGSWEALRSCPVAGNYPRVAFKFTNSIYILGGTPLCLDVSEFKEDPSPQSSASGSSAEIPIRKREWKEPHAIELPILNLRGKSTIIAKMQYQANE